MLLNGRLNGGYTNKKAELIRNVFPSLTFLMKE
jgi:hypothetical protein